MGQIIRLDTQFNNANLKKLINYDFDEIKQQILSLPTLRAFFDATDTSAMTFGAGNVVTQLKELGANALHFNQADIAKAPTHSTAGLNGVGGLYFNGSQSMKALNLFSGNVKGSVVIFMHGTGLTDGASRIIVSDALTNSQAFYANNTRLMAFSANTVLDGLSVNTKMLQFTTAFDAAANKVTIYADKKSATGTGSIAGAPSGDANLGTWTDALSSNNYVGYIGHVMVFDEDLSKNDAVRNLLTEYARRKYRLDI